MFREPGPVKFEELRKFRQYWGMGFQYNADMDTADNNNTDLGNIF